MEEETLCTLAGARTGHFVLESGYHCDRWFDLDRLFRPEQRARLQPFVVTLARQLAAQRIDALCGPATGGAQLAQRLAGELAVPYFFAERSGLADPSRLFSANYGLDAASRAALRGRRVALVDDAISTGSAVRSTHTALLACGAQPVVLGALIAFNDHAARFARAHGLALACLLPLSLGLWTPAECPFCHAGVSLSDAAQAPAAALKKRGRTAYP